MSVFSDRLNELGPRFDTVAGELVTYNNGVVSGNITVNLVLIDTEELMPGISVTHVEYTFLGTELAALQTLLGAGELPTHEDTITRSNGEILTVTSMGTDTPPYKYMVNSRQRIQITTIKTKGAT